MLNSENEQIWREIARHQGIPEEEYLWVMAQDDEIPEDQKPQWLKDREAETEAWQQSPEGRARAELLKTRFLAYAAADTMIRERNETST